MTVLKVGGQRLALYIEGAITQHSSASPPDPRAGQTNSSYQCISVLTAVQNDT